MMSKLLKNTSSNEDYNLKNLNHTKPTNPVYKYIDRQDRETLKPEDLVVIKIEIVSAVQIPYI